MLESEILRLCIFWCALMSEASEGPISFSRIEGSTMQLLAVSEVNPDFVCAQLPTLAPDLYLSAQQYFESCYQS